MEKRVLSVLLVMLIIASVLTGCSRSADKAEPPESSQIKKGGVLNDYLEDDPNGFDVQENTLLVTYTLARHLYSTLLRYKGDTLELEPELLAKMPEVSPDGRTYTFELKKGVKFHDGTTELVADDVKFTIERMLNPNGRGMSTWLFEPILGAKEFMEGKATSLEGFKKIDDYRFQIILEKPYAPFLHNLAVPAASIYSEKLVKAAGDNWRLNPIGTGPFRLKSYVPNTEIVLEKNPYYFEPGLPYLDGIHYRIVPDATTALMEFENGTLDVCTIPVNEYQRIKDSGKYEVLEGVALNTYYFLMNMSDPMWSDVRLRKAVAMAIDKEKLVQALYGPRGTVAKSFVTPGIPGAYEEGTGPAYDYNPEEAKKLIRELGNIGKLQAWQRGGDRLSDANVAIQAMLKEVGIDLEITIVEKAAFGDARSKGKIPATHGNWWADIPDPDNYLHTFFARTNQMSSGYNNKKVQDLLEKARTEVDAEKRKELYRRIEDIIIREDVAVIPLFHIKSLLATQKNVKGIIMHPTGINIYTYAYKEIQ
ncbi:ABC transporter substrate-binding protein [Thermosediminibacter oceani]|uniref:Extracellular solute-binding protein family 5 n=1 Tax=Thermosediminibacter oceani (strain ATCC BAA-1034 / DSM 16646 / JW/IW-1228P) TaxID=555079 RepID=D9S1V8_THEOJ|nr:ABC transporter substrate-binding protein [Thermosediminibacter oceani]ADL07385.1 extracellular solute-binding protein family 5 [Thermosediminibacter oceani DSM 16646]